jgi:hypothetical protein
MNIIARIDAIKLGSKHYFTGKKCKHGHVSKRRVNDRVCMECDLDAKKTHKYMSLEKSKEYKKSMYYKHIEKNLATKKEYRQANKGKINALCAARKIHIKQRTPKWLTEIDFDRIKNEYKLAEILSKLTGISYHVDHIIPLRGKLVSGLHVPSNLRVIIGKENISKKNKFEVV